MAKEQPSIGELSGIWSVMFKISMCVLPICVGIFVLWATWVTKSIFNNERAIAQHELKIEQKYTLIDALAREDKIRTDIYLAMKSLEDKIKTRNQRP